MATTISLLGLILSIIVIVIGAYKKFNIVILTVIATAILAITNQMNVIASFLSPENSYMSGLASFIADYLLVFLLASILAKYLEAGGAAKSIANYIINKIGKEGKYTLLVAVFIISAIFTLGGVSLYVAMFVIIPLSRDIFKKMDLSWRLIATPYLMGSATFTMTMIPGSPSVQNVIVAGGLGTPLTAAPLLGIILAVLTILWTLWRMKVELNQAEENGEGFKPEFDMQNVDVDLSNLPSFSISLIPLVTLFIAIIIGSVLEIEQTIIYALVISIIVAAVILNGRIKSHQRVLNEGTSSSISAAVNPAAAVGFGTVVSVSSGFGVILNLIQSLPITPLLSLILLTKIMQWTIGSSASILGIVTERFVPLYDLSAYNPRFVHRIVLVSSSYIPPQVGFLMAFYEVTGLSHKDSYRETMITLNGSVLIFTVVGYILGTLIY